MVLVFVFASSAWVVYDAITLKKETGKLVFSTDPVVWLIGCVLLWLIIFPLYLFGRSQVDTDSDPKTDSPEAELSEVERLRKEVARLKEANRPQPVVHRQKTFGKVTCGWCQSELKYSKKLQGKSHRCPSCKGEIFLPVLEFEKVSQ
jgi:hypothetical protein